MNNKKEVRMKMLRSLYQWGSLYIWFGIFIVRVILGGKITTQFN